MDITTWSNRRRIGRVAWISAWVTLAVGQVHALARHATADGRSDLDLPLTKVWAKPAADLLDPLLGWAGPDTVYLTYGKLWAISFAILTVTAVAAYRLRRPYGFEKVAWRMTIVGYGLATVGVAGAYWTQWSDYNAMFDAALAMSLPGLLLMLVGSTMLGCSLLRREFRPRGAAWLLALSLPFGLVITEVTSMGNVSLTAVFAFGLIGRRLALNPAYAEQIAAPVPDGAVPDPTPTQFA